MIQLSNLTKSFGDRVLLDSVSWQIDDHERVGLSGPNGAGKTTLLKMLAGLEEPDSGLIIKPSGLTVGYLPQDGLTHSGGTLLEEAGLAFKELLEMRAEIASLEERLADDSATEAEHAAMLTRYSDLQEAFRRHEGYSIDLKISTVLRGLGFSQADLEKPSETFSGGWQMRIALAKLLLGRPGLLLLDEPTNHLDLEARNWLEEYLADYPHAVILVSHDRFFLDAVVTRIAEIGLRTLTDYTGNYSDYLRAREARMEQLRQRKKEQDDEIARMEAFINRFRYQATKAAQVQSRIKMLDKIMPIEIPAERKRVHFSFPACAKSGRTVLDLRDVSKSYGDQGVFKRASLHIERGDRIALIGPNGSGKSTMMRMLSGVESPDSGTRTEGYQVIMQYFAQDEATRLDPTLTVYQTLAGDAPIHMVPHIRNILGGFLFSGDDVDKPVRVLSGGERTRLAVARMLLRPSNTLILDEPTNHLDLDSKDVLLEALEDFGGTLIFVSHDRYFVDKLATKVVDIGHGDALLYPGNYEEFLWSRKQQMAAASAPAPEPDRVASQKPAPARTPAVKREPPATITKPSSKADAQISYDERKRQEAGARRDKKAADAKRRRVEELEARIADRERAIKEIEEAMSAPGFYDDHESAKPVIDRHQALMWEVGDLMNQWEALQTELESCLKMVGTSTGSPDTFRKNPRKNPHATSEIRAHPLPPECRLTMHLPAVAVRDGCRPLAAKSQKEKSLAESSCAITILPSEAAAGFSLSPLMSERKLSGASRRTAPGSALAPKKRSSSRTPRSGDDSVANDGFYRDLVWTLRNGVLAITRDGRIAVMNEVAYRILGLTSKPSDIGTVFTTVLRDRPDVCRILAGAFDLSHLPNRAELRLKSTGKVIGYTLSQVRDRRGHITGATLFFKDLTRVEQLEERERLRDRLAALGEMAAAIAHEVKNPLAGIEVMAGILKRQLPESPDAQAILGDIIKEAKMANAIVLEILDFVRPIRLQVETITLADALRDAISMAESHVPRGEVAVDVALAPDLPSIHGDPHQLRQLFTNLLTNAFEALGGRGTVRILAARLAEEPIVGGEPQAGPSLLIEVIDDGPGVPADVMDRIFSPFFTTKPQGSGLGLAIVRKIVDAHDGRIDVSAPMAGGTRFRVTLPVKSSHELFR